MATKKAVSDEEVAEVLDKALRLMNNSGRHWIKGVFRRRRGGEDCYCSIGAIRAACPGRDKQAVRNAAYDALADALIIRASPSSAQSIIWWNDHRHTEWKNVVSRFRLARKRALVRAAKKVKS